MSDVKKGSVAGAIVALRFKGFHAEADAVARQQEWIDAVMGQETIATFYTTVNERQFFPEPGPFCSIPVRLITRPQPLAKE